MNKIKYVEVNFNNREKIKLPKGEISILSLIRTLHFNPGVIKRIVYDYNKIECDVIPPSAFEDGNIEIKKKMNIYFHFYDNKTQFSNIKIYVDTVSTLVSDKFYTLKDLMDNLGYKNIKSIECRYADDGEIITFDNQDMIVPIEENMKISIFNSIGHPIRKDIPDKYKPKFPDYVLNKINSKVDLAVGDDKKNKEAVDDTSNIFNHDPKIPTPDPWCWIPLNNNIRLRKISRDQLSIREIRKICNISDDLILLYSNQLGVHVPDTNDSVIPINESVRLYTFKRDIHSTNCMKQVKSDIAFFEKYKEKLPLYKFNINNVEYCTYSDKIPYDVFYDNFLSDIQSRNSTKTLYIEYKKNHKPDVKHINFDNRKDGIVVNIDSFSRVSKSYLDMELLENIEILDINKNYLRVENELDFTDTEVLENIRKIYNLFYDLDNNKEKLRSVNKLLDDYDATRMNMGIKLEISTINEMSIAKFDKILNCKQYFKVVLSGSELMKNKQKIELKIEHLKDEITKLLYFPK